MAPSFQAQPVISFFSEVTLGGLLSTVLGARAEQALEVSTALVMNVPSAAVVFQGAVPVNFPRSMRGTTVIQLQTEDFHLQGSKNSRRLQTSTVTASLLTTLSLVDFPEFAGDSTALFDSLRKFVSDASSNGEYTRILQEQSKLLNATVTSSATVLTIIVDNPVIIQPPTFQPTSAPAETLLTDGEIAMIVVLPVVFIALMIWFYFYWKNCYFIKGSLVVIGDVHSKEEDQPFNKALHAQLEFADEEARRKSANLPHPDDVSLFRVEELSDEDSVEPEPSRLIHQPSTSLEKAMQSRIESDLKLADLEENDDQLVHKLSQENLQLLVQHESKKESEKNESKSDSGDRTIVEDFGGNNDPGEEEDVDSIQDGTQYSSARTFDISPLSELREGEEDSEQDELDISISAAKPGMISGKFSPGKPGVSSAKASPGKPGSRSARSISPFHAENPSSYSSKRGLLTRDATISDAGPQQTLKAPAEEDNNSEVQTTRRLLNRDSTISGARPQYLKASLDEDSSEAEVTMRVFNRENTISAAIPQYLSAASEDDSSDAAEVIQRVLNRDHTISAARPQYFSALSEDDSDAEIMKRIFTRDATISRANLQQLDLQKQASSSEDGNEDDNSKAILSRATMISNALPGQPALPTSQQTEAIENLSRRYQNMANSTEADSPLVAESKESTEIIFERPLERKTSRQGSDFADLGQSSKTFSAAPSPGVSVAVAEEYPSEKKSDVESDEEKDTSEIPAAMPSALSSFLNRSNASAYNVQPPKTPSSKPRSPSLPSPGYEDLNIPQVEEQSEDEEDTPGADAVADNTALSLQSFLNRSRLYGRTTNAFVSGVQRTSDSNNINNQESDDYMGDKEDDDDDNEDL